MTTFTFEGSFQVDGGKVTAGGTQFSDRDNGFPISGGTGRFLGAEGIGIPFQLPNQIVLLIRVIT